MDMLVIKIMNFAQRLVDADRASLFLVDSKSKELYATIFDVGIDCNNINHGSDSGGEENGKQPPSREIRFPIGTVSLLNNNKRLYVQTVTENFQSVWFFTPACILIFYVVCFRFPKVALEGMRVCLTDLVGPTMTLSIISCC